MIKRANTVKPAMPHRTGVATPVTDAPARSKPMKKINPSFRTMSHPPVVMDREPDLRLRYISINDGLAGFQVQSRKTKN